MTPEETIKLVSSAITNIEAAKRKVVAVGLPTEEVGSNVYKGGKTVIEVGAFHEFGAPPFLPQRSFLRSPFMIKEDLLAEELQEQWRQVIEEGLDADTALGRIGVLAQSISQEAFTTKGYGTWVDIKDSTKIAKGSSQVLIHKGILRGSITWVIR